MSESNHSTLPLFPEDPVEPETWKDVPDWEGVYQASTLGRVRRIKPNPRGPKAVGRILKPFISTGRYLYINLNDAPRLCHALLHQVIARTFIGPPPQNMEVDHINGKKDDPRLSNLEYVTRKENLRRARALGLSDLYRCSKLTKAQILDIRARTGETGTALAAEFGVSIATMSRIRNGQRYVQYL